jgi:hypothetical protein
MTSRNKFKIHASLSRLGTKPVSQRRVDVANDLNKISFLNSHICLTLFSLQILLSIFLLSIYLFAFLELQKLPLRLFVHWNDAHCVEFPFLINFLIACPNIIMRC